MDYNRPEDVGSDNFAGGINRFQILKEVLGQSTMLYLANHFWRETKQKINMNDNTIASDQCLSDGGP